MSETEGSQPTAPINKSTQYIDKPKPDMPGRRRALKFLGATGLSAVSLLIPGSTAQTPPPEQPKPKETENNNSVLFLDIDIKQFKEEALRDHFKGHDVSVSDIEKKLGIEGVTTIDGLKSAVPNGNDETFVLMLKALGNHYTGHGDILQKVDEKTSQYLNSPNHPQVRKSVTGAIHLEGVTYDEKQDPTLWFNVDPKAVDEIVSHSPQSVINLSFEMGKVGFKYELHKLVAKNPDMQRLDMSTTQVGDGPISYSIKGKEVSKEEYDRVSKMRNEKTIKLWDEKSREFWPQDAYFGDRVDESIENIVNLANKYPDKTFVASAGALSSGSLRARPDIRKIRTKLEKEGKWPKNLLMVGIWGHDSGVSGPVNLGADFYVDQNYLSGVPQGDAAFATPVVTELVTILRNKGITNPDEIRKNLNFMSDNKASPDEPPYWVINSPRIKATLPRKF